MNSKGETEMRSLSAKNKPKFRFLYIAFFEWAKYREIANQIPRQPKVFGLTKCKCYHMTKSSVTCFFGHFMVPPVKENERSKRVKSKIYRYLGI